jgi:hypothetical protein
MMKAAFALAAALLATTPALAKSPDCAGKGNWTASMVFVAMKNAKLLTNDQVDFDRTEVTRLASEQVKKGLWRQIHLVRYYRKDGTYLEAVAVNDASNDECSMSEVRTLVISEELLPNGQRSN